MKHKKIPRDPSPLVVADDQRHVSIYCAAADHEGTVWGVRTYIVWPNGNFIAAHYYLNPDGSTRLAQDVKPINLPEDERTEGWGHRNVEHLECRLCGRRGAVDARSEKLAPILAKWYAASKSELPLSVLAAILTGNRRL